MRKQELHPRTAIINKKQKNQAKIARNEALAWLAEKFPAAFDIRHLIQPLKLGIMTDILAHAEEAALAGISKSKLREAVVLFTRRIDYLACLKAREMRIDLEGKATTSVTEEEAFHAASKIKKQVEKSAKNAKKLLVSKPKSELTLSATHHSNYSLEQEGSSRDPMENWASCGGQNFMASPARVTSVIVKHKPSRTYDPDAVARLKEKLGLSRSSDKTN